MDTNHILKFINFITEGYENKGPLFWEVRLINENGEVKQHFFNNVEKLKRYFGEDYLKNFNCYLGILPRTKEEGTTEAVKFGNVFVVDLDSSEAINKVNEIYSNLFELGLRPSIIANSGHGLHVYFKIDRPVDILTWKELQEKFLLFFTQHFSEHNPDTQVKDPTRIMRIIGTLNVKKDPPVKTQLLIEDYTIHKLETLQKILKDIEPIKEIFSVIQQTRPKKHIPKWLENVIEQGVNEGERDKWRFVVALNLWKRGFSQDEIEKIIWKFNSKCRPPEKESVIKRHLRDLPHYCEKFLQEHPEINPNDYRKIIETYNAEKEELPQKELPVILEKDLENIVLKEPEWIVEKYIPEKAIIMLAGKRASFKSWLALYMAVCIAKEKNFLNKFKTKRTLVLYIDEENGIDEIKRKLKKIKEGLNIKEGLDNLAFLCFEGVKIDQKIDRDRLESFLKDHNPCVIIVDAFRRIIKAEENDATEVNRVFTDFLRPLQEKYNVTWVLLHHLRKGISGKIPDDILDELRGSSELTNVADSVIVVEKPTQLQNRIILRHEKARRSKQCDPYIVELKWGEEDSSVAFECIGTAEEILEAVDLCAKAIMVWCEEEDIETFKTKEVIEKMKGKNFPRPTIYRALSILKAQGKIGQEKRGLYKVIKENLREFVSKSQLSHETNDINNKESIKSIKVYSSETIETKDEKIESLNRLNNINFETIETIETTQKQTPSGVVKIKEAEKELRELVKFIGKRIPKGDLETKVSKEIIKKWLNEGVLAEWYDGFYTVHRFNIEGD